MVQFLVTLVFVLLTLVLAWGQRGPGEGTGLSVWQGGTAGGSMTADGTNNFFWTQGGQSPTISENSRRNVMPIAGQVSRLSCILLAAPTGTYTLTFRKNLADTPVTCVVTGTATGCVGTGSVTVAAGDIVTFNGVASGTPTPRSANCSVVFQPS
jgi:hypothetical protein